MVATYHSARGTTTQRLIRVFCFFFVLVRGFHIARGGGGGLGRAPGVTPQNLNTTDTALSVCTRRGVVLAFLGISCIAACHFFLDISVACACRGGVTRGGWRCC